MAKKLFLTRSNHDIGNAYLHAYSDAILNEAELRGWHVEKAENDKNTRQNVSSRLENKPSLAVFNGHGSEKEVFGIEDAPIVDSSNSHLLSGTICFIRACGCLAGLGAEAVKKGAKAVIGYKGDFWIPRVNEYQATPLRDPSAKPVLDASNAVPLKLLKGATAKEAVEASKKKANEAILHMLVREEPYDSPALKALINNNRFLELQGNENATP